MSLKLPLAASTSCDDSSGPSTCRTWT